MIVSNETTLTTDSTIGKFFDMIWEDSLVDTMLYRDDAPVGLICAWGREDDGHTFAVRPDGKPASEYETKPAIGDLRFRSVITDKGAKHIAVDVISA